MFKGSLGVGVVGPLNPGVHHGDSQRPKNIISGRIRFSWFISNRPIKVQIVEAHDYAQPI